MDPKIAILLSALLTACTGSADLDLLCGPAQHFANPDGRGERCIEDASSCESSADCGPLASECCAPACADPTGSGVYECVQSCEEPACTPGSCGEGFFCQAGLDECTAYCVPDGNECPFGRFPADPTGTGQFVCVRDDSECVTPADCGSLADPCCTPVCGDAGDARFVCTSTCGAVDGQDQAAQEWVCGTDADCEVGYGPGWTCLTDGCWGNTCVAPQAECVTAADCAIVRDTSYCCSCPFVVPRTQVGGNCWAESGGGAAGDPVPGGGAAAPEQMCDVACDAVECAECAEVPLDVACDAGQCLAVY